MDQIRSSRMRLRFTGLRICLSTSLQLPGPAIAPTCLTVSSPTISPGSHRFPAQLTSSVRSSSRSHDPADLSRRLESNASVRGARPTAISTFLRLLQLFVSSIRISPGDQICAPSLFFSTFVSLDREIASIPGAGNAAEAPSRSPRPPRYHGSTPENYQVRHLKTLEDRGKLTPTAPELITTSDFGASAIFKTSRQFVRIVSSGLYPGSTRATEPVARTTFGSLRTVVNFPSKSLINRKYAVLRANRQLAKTLESSDLILLHQEVEALGVPYDHIVFARQNALPVQFATPSIPQRSACFMIPQLRRKQHRLGRECIPTEAGSPRCSFASISAVFRPYCEARIAQSTPGGPPPITTTSKIVFAVPSKVIIDTDIGDDIDDVFAISIALTSPELKIP